MAGTGYTRQSSFDDGDVITAALFNNEYNQLLNAFVYAASGTTGHQHDGGSGEGGNIETIGDQDFLNKLVVDSTNNRWGFFVEVSSSAVEQVRIQDGAIVPVTDNDIDLGASALQFKDAYINGTLEADAITIAGITLSETIADTVGAMVTSNTETGIAVTYDDADNTLDFVIGAGAIVSSMLETNITIAGNISVGGTVDGRDVATDGTKLDGIEASATADQTNAEIRTAVEAASDSNVFTDADHTKLDGIEAGADVVSTTSVTAAGALMDSELTDLASVKAINQGLATTDSPTFVDLTVSGDDITMGTNTADALLVADGTNFSPTTIGSLSELSSIASDDVFLAIDTSGGGLKKVTRSTIVQGLATSSAIANVVEDTTPQLGGNLDSQGNDITSVGSLSAVTVTISGDTTIGDAAADDLTVNSTIKSNLIFTDATYDIGASGATRPRNIFLSGNATISGDTTIGDAAADDLTVNSTIKSNLIFTDDTYDIGASGATRPRNIFLSGNAAVGGRVSHSTITTLSSDGTPSVSAGNYFVTGDTTTITDFDDGVVGQTIHILAEHAKTITDNAAIILDGSANFVMAVADTLTLTMFNDQVWQETGRTTNVAAGASYEEGTWTPVYATSYGETAPNLTYAVQSGYYTKVGRLVTCWFRLTADVVTSKGQGMLRIEGLPYTVDWVNGGSDYAGSIGGGYLSWVKYFEDENYQSPRGIYLHQTGAEAVLTMHRDDDAAFTPLDWHLNPANPAAASHTTYCLADDCDLMGHFSYLETD